MPIKCKVNADRSLTFSGTAPRGKYWRKNPDAYGNSADDYLYGEKQFIEDMGFEWLGYDSEEGRGLWGGPVWTDGNLYWTYSHYALRSFLQDLQEDKIVHCELSQWDDYAPNVRWIFEDANDAKEWLRENLTDGYSWFSDADDSLDLAQKLSDYEFELDATRQLHEMDNG